MSNRVYTQIKALLFATSLLTQGLLYAPEVRAQGTEKAPVDFMADQVLYDDDEEIVTAIGGVKLTQNGRTLQADSILYKLKDDQVTAVGNVVLTESDGSKYYADKVRLREQFQEGYVSALRGVLPDGGNFSALYAERLQEGGDKIVMREATYTSCQTCEDNPDKKLPWQLKASRVVHDRAEKEIRYNNATFEVKGVPILYTPYFSHPDGSEDQKSGLVDPVLGFDSELGTYTGASYYFALAPDKDATLGMTAYTNEAPLINGEYRQRFEKGEVNFSGTTTYSDRIVSIAGSNTELDDEIRANFKASGLWEINEKWRGGFDIDIVSDDQYLRQYDISDEDILENQLYLERFSGRNYADVRLIGYQDTRLIAEQTDSPNILPEGSISFLGNPGETLGGRWSFDASALSLQRDGSDPDTNRFTLNLGWQAHKKTDMGIASTLSFDMRGDYYYLLDQGAMDDDFQEMRGIARVNWEASYPLIKPLDHNGSHAVIEPIVMLTGVTPDDDQDELSNEDSQDTRLSSNNLFDENRFTGYDRVEDQSRVTYGLKTSYYGSDDLEFSFFGGQSYNFDEEQSFFAEGSGLESQSSDYVAEIGAKYKNKLDMAYRSRFDKSSLNSRTHEVDLFYDGKHIDLSGLYFFSKRVVGSDFDETREQLTGAGRLRLNENWYTSGGLTYDLGIDPGLREADFGIEYLGECYSIGTFINRDLTNDNSGDADTTISIRIGLRNLGNFEASSTIVDTEED